MKSETRPVAGVYLFNGNIYCVLEELYKERTLQRELRAFVLRIQLIVISTLATRF